jgi:hypothetical protein
MPCTIRFLVDIIVEAPGTEGLFVAIPLHGMNRDGILKSDRISIPRASPA